MEFREEWSKAYANWYGKFSGCEKKTGRTEWCHLWNGPHCMFGDAELIPGETIVGGTNTSPVFFTPKQWLEKYGFSHCNPFTGKHEPEGTAYREALEKIKAQIMAIAAR